MKTILYRLDIFVELNETKTNLLFHLDLAEVSPKLQAKLFSFFFTDSTVVRSLSLSNLLGNISIRQQSTALKRERVLVKIRQLFCRCSRPIHHVLLLEYSPLPAVTLKAVPPTVARAQVMKSGEGVRACVRAGHLCR